MLVGFSDALASERSARSDNQQNRIRIVARGSPAPKTLLEISGQMIEVSRRVRFQSFLTLSLNEGVFNKLENKLCMIPDKYHVHEFQVMEDSSTCCAP